MITLTIGEPDFATPAARDRGGAPGGAARARRNIRRRTAPRALKAAVQRKFKREHGLEFALDQIMVANGGKQVIFNALLATVDEGDEVVIPAPYWAPIR